ncbi:unnamed protein product [Prorocentrum cordatum]|uniref:AB hydrolase-1 domain-containing protein n=1 Tax=Prorocentrum cordatum TaxID=2364126 RepID=A0ABN9T2J5_9DINO|nr:unnamed protein product [Polarella glacialis]
MTASRGAHHRSNRLLLVAACVIGRSLNHRRGCAVLPGPSPWSSWETRDGLRVDSRRPEWHGRLARRAALAGGSGDEHERAEFLVAHEARHGRWAYEGLAQAMCNRGHAVHFLSLPRLGDDARADEAALAGALEAVRGLHGAGQHLVVLGHGLSATSLCRCLAAAADPAALCAAAVLAAPWPLRAGVERQALAAAAAAASDEGLCRRLMFSPGAAGEDVGDTEQTEDVAFCVSGLRLSEPLADEAPASAAAAPALERCLAAGSALSDRILVVGGGADALVPQEALDEIADAFLAGDPIVMEGCGHTGRGRGLFLDSRSSKDAAGVVLDWTRLLFSCGYLA